jgi:transcriptional regulator with XRE-family HTH domain
MPNKTKHLDPIQSRLVTLRASLDLSHEQTAALLGVSPHTLRKWIDGERAPGGLLVRLLDVLDLVQTMAPAIHAALVRDIVADKPKGKPGRPVGFKLGPKPISKI